MRIKRPVLILGAGAREDKDKLIKFAKVNDLPILLTWGAIDFLPDDHPNNCRDFGTTSQRAGNFILKHADLIISVGSRLDSHTIDISKLKAKMIICDIDPKEHQRFKKAKIENILQMKFDISPTWLGCCKALRMAYPICRTSYMQQETVNPYVFMEYLSDSSKNGDVIVTDAGQTVVWTFQGWKVKKDQRLLTALNNSPMGYAIPASVGAYYATKKPVICITGDGGLMMNIQELETISKLPIKIFVLDNNGYGMIKQTQSDWPNLKNNHYCDKKTGLTFPNFEKIANAFNIRFTEINKRDDLPKIHKLLDSKRAEFCVVKIPDGEKIIPKLKFGDDFEDQTPKLTEAQKDGINALLG